jgi:hypothetical protein
MALLAIKLFQIDAYKQAGFATSLQHKKDQTGLLLAFISMG